MGIEHRGADRQVGAVAQDVFALYRIGLDLPVDELPARGHGVECGTALQRVFAARHGLEVVDHLVHDDGTREEAFLGIQRFIDVEVAAARIPAKHLAFLVVAGVVDEERVRLEDDLRWLGRGWIA